jgi:hypothetical protein
MKKLIKNIKDKAINFIYNSFLNKMYLKNQILIRLSLGRIESKINLDKKSKNINDFEFKVFSQFGEDGIIQYLINNLKIYNKKFIEFGVENYEEANTRFLLENNNWSGLIIDSSQKNINHITKQNYYWRNDLIAINAFVSTENINDIIKKNNFNGNIGLLSIDIDGNDYWILKSINAISPDIIIIEYNANFGLEKSLTVKYNENFQRAKLGIDRLVYGCSLKAAFNLCKEKGYSLVCTNSNGNNAFFVKNNLLNEKIISKNIGEVFQVNSFKEYVDVLGNFHRISGDQIDKIQQSILVQEV